MNLGQPSRLVLVLVGMASIFIIMFGIRTTAVVLNPILLAIVITIAVLPLPTKLTQRGMPSWLALIVTVGSVVGVLAIVIILFVVGITKLSVSLPSYADDIAARSQQAAAWLGANSDIQADSGVISQFSTRVLGWIGSALTATFMTLLIFVFMIAAAVSLPRSTRNSLQTDSPLFDRVANLTVDVRRYLSIMTTVNFLVGLANTILLWILGVDFAVLWGLLSWLLGYIPTVGFWLALIPPTILAWAELGPTTALIVFLGYVLINGTVQNFLQPKMMGERLSISPVVVFVSLFVWAWLLGGIGAILAVPLTLLILTFLESFEGTRWVVTLLRMTPEHKQGEKSEARARLNTVWSRVRTAVRSEVGPQAVASATELDATP